MATVLGSLFATFTSTVFDAARLGILPGQQQTPTGRRKKKVECTPCAAAARVDAARKIVRGGR